MTVQVTAIECYQALITGKALPVGVERTPVDFWFDPICPWAWMTSRWMVEVENVRPVSVNWHVMSLAVLNDLPADSPAWGPARVCAAAADQFGEKVLFDLYTALGERFHVRQMPQDRATISEALAEAGLPAELADVMESDEYDEFLRTSHERAMDQVGQEVGTPVIAVEGSAFFGPVISPAPKGEAAGVLWDGVRVVAGYDGFYELKRSRTRGPIFT